MQLSRLYAIADADVLAARGVELAGFAEELAEAGVTLVQWRAKSLAPRTVLEGAAVLRAGLGKGATLVMNDRADLAVLAGFDGVHVGQDDLAVADVRRVAGAGTLVGLSTHTPVEMRAAVAQAPDYVAIGPVFATGSKADASPVVGLEGVRRARAQTALPLVAIGGITRENAHAVIDAGADSVAVISGLLVAGEPVAKVARDFLDLFR